MPTEEEVLQKLANVLQVDPVDLTRTTKAFDIARWDSMGTLDIIMMLEQEFDLVVEINETDRIQSVGGIIEFLRGAGKLG